MKVRLKKLEEMVAARRGELVTAVFADGSEMRLRLPDIIDMLLTKNTPVDVIGDGGPGSGHLAALIRELLNEPPEVEQ